MKEFGNVLKTIVIILVLLLAVSFTGMFIYSAETGEHVHIPVRIAGKEATCTQSGQAEGLVCSVCGEVLKGQEEIPALGHDFGEESCRRCGLDYSMPALYVDNGVEYALSMNGKIGLTFRYVLSEEEAQGDGYVQFTVNGETEQCYVKDAPIGSDGKYVFTKEISVLYFSKEVTVQKFDGNGVGGNIYTRSVKDYCDIILAGQNLYEMEKTFVRALLNYVGYVQVYNGETENIVNDGLYTSSNDPVSKVTAEELSVLTEGENSTGRTTTTGIQLSSMMISLTGDVALRYIFTFSDGYDFSKYKIGVSDGVTFDCSGSTLSLEDISPLNLDKFYTVTIENVQDGTKMTLKYSVLSFATRYLNLGNENLSNVVKAMYLYNVAAHGYFEAKTKV